MLVSHDRRGRGLQDVLRSIGAVLDSNLARAVLVKEVETGLVVRARVSTTLEDRLAGASVPLERAYSKDELLEEQLAAVGRRGSGHLAGPIERAMRTIGRMADDRHLAELVIIQHDSEGAWLLWHNAVSNGKPELLAFSADELEQLDMAVTPAARRRAATALTTA